MSLRRLAALARGRQAEVAAEEYLCARGLRFLARNFRVRGGEVDLILEDGETLVFVEVRARDSDRQGGALESVTAAKQRKLLLAAGVWLQQRPRWAQRPCRFDVIGFEGRGQQQRIEWIRGAFTA